MKLYKAYILRDILKEFIDSCDWSDYLDDSKTIDSVFSMYSDLHFKVSKAFINTKISRSEVLEEAKVMKDALDKKINILKKLALREIVNGDLESAENVCEQILAVGLQIRDLDTLIMKFLVSTEV